MGMRCSGDALIAARCPQLPGRRFATWREYFLKVVLVGAGVAAEICVRNLSFLYVVRT